MKNVLPTVWLELEKQARKTKRELLLLEQMLFEQAISMGPEDPDSGLFIQMAEKIREITPPDFHMQSEWTGGNSDDPKNHTMREPNCCPNPRRRFTKEELEAANLTCHGPCDWTEKEKS